MKPFRSQNPFLAAGLALTLAALGAGCRTATNSASTLGKATCQTVATSGQVAATVVATTATTAGQVAGTAVTTGGTVVVAAGPLFTSAAHATGNLAQPAMVKFQDTTTGVIREVPWTDGLKLYAGGQAAKITMAAKAFQILRGGATIHTDSNQIAAGVVEPTLKPGDVVKVAPLTGTALKGKTSHRY